MLVIPYQNNNVLIEHEAHSGDKFSPLSFYLNYSWFNTGANLNSYSNVLVLSELTKVEHSKIDERRRRCYIEISNSFNSRIEKKKSRLDDLREENNSNNQQFIFFFKNPLAGLYFLKNIK